MSESKYGAGGMSLSFLEKPDLGIGADAILIAKGWVFVAVHFGDDDIVSFGGVGGGVVRVYLVPFRSHILAINTPGSKEIYY